MKPKEPIALSSLVEYYVEEPTLRRDKSELIAEIKDLITITDFLSARIPSIMKNIKENVRVQQKIIKDVSTNLKSELRVVTEDPKYECSYYLKSAYDLFCNFSFNKESDKDYVEKTIAEKDMKLKYLESANLVNYLWHKPAKGNFAWKNYFNPKTNMIEVVSRKFTVYVGMAVAERNYVWDIKEVRVKVTGDHEQWLKDYFEEKMRPALKDAYSTEYEEHVLFAIDHFSKCFELLELHLNICEISQQIPFTKEIKYVYEETEYEFNFMKPEEFKFPEVIITIPSKDYVKIKLEFNKDSVKGVLEISDKNQNLQCVFETENEFKYEDTESLFEIFRLLTEFAERFIKFEVLLQSSNLSIENMKEHIFIKINGCIWKECKMGNIFEVLKSRVNGNGLFLGGNYQNYSTYVEITSEGKLFSKFLSKPILTNLVKKIPSIKVLFYFCILVEQILPSNKIRDCSMEFCKLHEEQNSLVLFLQKRLWLEEQMIKLIPKEEENIFNYSKFLLMIPFSFKNINFFVLREKEQKHAVPFDNWDKKLKEYDENEMMKLNVVIEIVKEIQDNVMLKYIYEKRMINNSKPTIGLSM